MPSERVTTMLSTRPDASYASRKVRVGDRVGVRVRVGVGVRVRVRGRVHLEEGGLSHQGDTGRYREIHGEI